MGFFIPSLKDVEKAKNEKNVKKLSKLLGSDNPLVADAAMEALEGYGAESFHEGMVGRILSGYHQSLKTRLWEMAQKYPDPAIKSLITAIANDIGGLRQTKTEEDLIVHDNWPALAEAGKKYFLQFKDVSLPLLRELLHDEMLILNIYASEVLADLGDLESQERWEYFLGAKKIIKKKPRFRHLGLMNSMPLGEIPLVMGSIHVMTDKSSYHTDYQYGLTDEKLYIVPGVNIPGQRYMTAALPLALIDKIGFGTYVWKQLGGLIKEEQKTIELSCLIEVVNPYDLDGPKVNVLHFGILPRYGALGEERAKRLIELFDILKSSSRTKSELFETFFDKKWVSL